MARNQPRSSASKTSSAKCACNPGWLLLALILFSIGLYALVGGFGGQFSGVWGSAQVLSWYFLGFLFISVGKMSKWKAGAECTVHKMN